MFSLRDLRRKTEFRVIDTEKIKIYTEVRDGPPIKVSADGKLFIRHPPSGVPIHDGNIDDIPMWKVYRPVTHKNKPSKMPFTKRLII